VRFDACDGNMWDSMLVTGQDVGFGLPWLAAVGCGWPRQGYDRLTLAGVGQGVGFGLSWLCPGRLRLATARLWKADAGWSRPGQAEAHTP
jgi:hypothetical protein